MSINLKSLIYHGGLMNKIAAALFGTTTNGLEPTMSGAVTSSPGNTPEGQIDPIPVQNPHGGITGVKRVFRANRNIQGTFTKTAVNYNHGYEIIRTGINLNNTLHKARSNADRQTLFNKDNSTIDKPSDIGMQATSRDLNKGLSHLEDKRIKKTPYNLKGKNTSTEPAKTIASVSIESSLTP